MIQTNRFVLWHLTSDETITSKELCVLRRMAILYGFYCLDPYGLWLPNTRRVRKILRKLRVVQDLARELAEKVEKE